MNKEAERRFLEPAKTESISTVIQHYLAQALIKACLFHVVAFFLGVFLELCSQQIPAPVQS